MSVPNPNQTGITPGASPSNPIATSGPSENILQQFKDSTNGASTGAAKTWLNRSGSGANTGSKKTRRYSSGTTTKPVVSTGGTPAPAPTPAPTATPDALRSTFADKLQEEIDNLNAQYSSNSTYYQNLANQTETADKAAAGAAAGIAASAGGAFAPGVGAAENAGATKTATDLAAIQNQKLTAEQGILTSEQGVLTQEQTQAQNTITAFATGGYGYNDIPAAEKQALMDQLGVKSDTDLRAYFESAKATKPIAQNAYGFAQYNPQTESWDAFTPASLAATGSLGSQLKGPQDYGTLGSALAEEESGNDYGSVGKQLTSGQNAGYSALGKYQIMPNLWFSTVTPDMLQAAGITGQTTLDPNNQNDVQLFLSTPALQDALFTQIIGSLAQANGNSTVKTIAAYFGGENAANAYGTPQGDKITDGQTTVNQYVNNVLKNLGGGPSTDPVVSMAQQLVNGTLAPSQLSKRSTGTASYQNIINEAIKLDPSFNAEKADEQFAYGKATQTQATQASLAYTTQTLSDLKGLSQNVDRSNITFGNQPGLWLDYNGSDPATVAFVTKANGAIDDVAAALGGGVSTDAKLAIAKSILDPALSQTAFTAQVNTDLATIEARQTAIANQAGQGGGAGSIPSAGSVGTLPNGTQVTMNADGLAYDDQGNAYDPTTGLPAQ